MKNYTSLLVFVIILTGIVLPSTLVDMSDEVMIDRPILTNVGTEIKKNPVTSEPESLINQYLTLPTGIIQVNLFDYQTSNPLGKADIFVYKIGEVFDILITSGQCDSSGFFEVGGLEAGNYNISVIKSLYQNESKTVKLRTDSDRINANIYLSKIPLNSGFIEIFTIDSGTYAPLEASVIVYDETGKLVISTVLDSSGFVNITDLSVQTYILLISMSGYVSQKEIVTIDYIGDNDRSKCYLNPVGSGEGFIEVYTMDIAGTLLDGVLIKVYNLTMGLIFEGSTNGFLNITDLEIGSYNVSVSLTGYSSQFQITEIRYPNDRDKLKFILIKSTGNGFIYGKIFDNNNIPIFNATVEIYSENKLLDALYTTVDGDFNFTNLIIGKAYIILPDAEGHIPDRSYVKLGVIGYAKVVFFLRAELSTNGNFEVYIKNNTHYIENAYVELYNSTENLLNTYFTNSNGFVNITGLMIGQYKIFVLKEGYTTAKVVGEISYDGDSDELVVVLRPLPRSLPATGIIRIYVRDEDGEVVQDAFVRVLGEMVSYSNYTGEKGDYSTENLYIGTYQITVSKKGYADANSSTVINYVGDVDLIEITLYPEETSSISLYLSLPDKPDDPVGEVFIRYKLDDGVWSKWLVTDDSGYIQLPNTKIGTYTLEILRSGCEPQSQTVIVSELGREMAIGSLLDRRLPDGIINHYALIVAGQYDMRFTIDAFGMYSTILNYYGYTSDKVYLLAPRSTHPTTGDPIPYDRLTSRQNIIWALNEISINADEDDTVLIWWTGHGGYDEMDTYTDTITASDFDCYLDRIICSMMNVFLGPCHSGSFIDDLNVELNRAIFTSCGPDEGGSAYSRHSFWSWATYKALHPLEDAILADYNSDGTITLDELYDFAYDFVRITKGISNQHPLLWENLGAPTGNTFLGDGTYASPTAEMSIKYLIQSADADGEIFLDEPEDVEVYTLVSVIDNELEDDDFSFQAIRSGVYQSLIALYCLLILFKKNKT